MINSNEYFEGTVKSLAYKSQEGDSTVGVMEPGDYQFGTSAHEKMSVIEGQLDVQMPDSAEWVSYKQGESFEVEANSSFKVKSIGQTAYLCQYS